MVLHKNFYPQAGTVEVAGDPSWSWDGQRWQHGGRIAAPARGMQLIGKPASTMAGWYYDWNQYAWVEPAGNNNAVHALTLGRPLLGGGGGTALRYAHPLTINPAAMHNILANLPHPPAPPAPPPPPAPVPTTTTKEEDDMSCKHCEHHHSHRNEAPDLYNSLKSHPWMPVIGAAFLVGSEFVAEPQPPQIPPDLPESYQKLWMMIYDQNRTKYRDRKALLDKIGGVLFGLGTANAGVSAAEKHADELAHVLPAKKAA